MKIKVGLIQDHPVFFNRSKTLEKIEDIIRQNADQNYDLLVFPESFIPGYPRGFDFGAKIGSRSADGRDLYRRFHDQSLDLDSEDLVRLEKISEKTDTYLIIGVSEKQKNNGSLFCSMLYISPSGGLLGVHRKIKPTGTERLIWGEASGESLVSFDTKIGRLGGLICWENYMPEARMAMYKKGVQIYVAPTADSRDGWIATMRHIALEGRCFVLGCNQFMTKSMYPEDFLDLVRDEPEILCPGGSIIVSPLGQVIEGPIFNSNGILTAILDLDDISRSKLDFDPNGHYSRPDIFEFKVNGQPETVIENTLKIKNK